MNFKILLCLLGIIGFTPIVSAGQSEQTTLQDVKSETSDLLQSLKNYSADKKDLAIKKSEMALVKLDNHIDALETRFANKYDEMDRASREKLQQSLKALHKQRLKVAESYGSLKESSVSAWDHLKKGFSNAYQDLHKAWENSEKEFDSYK